MRVVPTHLVHPRWRLGWPCRAFRRLHPRNGWAVQLVRVRLADRRHVALVIGWWPCRPLARLQVALLKLRSAWWGQPPVPSRPGHTLLLELCHLEQIA